MDTRRVIELNEPDAMGVVRWVRTFFNRDGKAVTDPKPGDAYGAIGYDANGAAIASEYGVLRGD
jgi:hypothetical protein